MQYKMPTCMLLQDNRKLSGFFSFHRPCSVHLILLINVDLLMNTSILTWDTIDTSEIFSTFVKTQQIKPHSFYFMHYFNNVLNKILMSWKFLELNCSYPCLHGSSPSITYLHIYNRIELWWKCNTHRLLYSELPLFCLQIVKIHIVQNSAYHVW